ncbi:MAG: class I SAM-dependent methyltransferase [Acidimicrobiia bacterium]
MAEDAYGSIAKWYDTVLGPVSRPLRDLVLQLEPPTPAMKVLDVACGTGVYLEACLDAGAECAGIDLSESMLAVATERLGDGADLTLGDATDMPYDDETFDLTVTSLFLHELDTETAMVVISEMVRVTTLGGTALVVDYRAGSLRWKGKAWRGFSYATERMAGGRHYRAWRYFMAKGGVPNALPMSVEIDKERIVAGGNLAVWWLRRSS